MKGIPVGCYRIMNWHLHLEARDLLYPTGWMLQKNLNVVIPVKWIWFDLIRLRISGFIQEVCSIPHLSLSLSLCVSRKAKNLGTCSMCSLISMIEIIFVRIHPPSFRTWSEVLEKVSSLGKGEDLKRAIYLKYLVKTLYASPCMWRYWVLEST